MICDSSAVFEFHINSRDCGWIGLLLYSYLTFMIKNMSDITKPKTEIGICASMIIDNKYVFDQMNKSINQSINK